jgi:hypothetical protein
VGWLLDITPTYDGQIEAALAFIANPPDLTTIDQGIQNLADNYLSIRACFQALPPPPAGEEVDPWEKLRSNLVERMAAALAALEAAGGPV